MGGVPVSWGGTLVALDDDELQLARKIGRERQANKEKRRVQSRKSSAKLDDTTAHIVGVMGELAVAKHLEGEIDKNIRAGGDRWDVKMPCGHHVSVRTRDGDANRHPDRVILSNSRRESRTNTVCCIKRGMIVEIVGLWAKGDDVDIHDFGYGPRDTILFSKLRPLDQVEKHIEECMDR